jgi:hypothetical protein
MAPHITGFTGISERLISAEPTIRWCGDECL